MTKSVDRGPDRGTRWLLLYLNSSVIIGNYLQLRLQQTIFSDAFFSLRFEGKIL